MSLLTPDTAPAGHFFNQTQSPWDAHKTTQFCETKNIQRSEFIECVMADSPHLKHGNVGSFWRGGQVAATRHRVLRGLHIQLASQDTFVIDLLLTHTVQREQVILRVDNLSRFH